MSEMRTLPGAAWHDIVSRSSLQAFSSAFTARPILEAAVIATPVIGAEPIFDFFRSTRTMYDHIAFVHETRGNRRSCLEWKGAFQGKDVSGATILAFDIDGLVERIRLFHYPNEQQQAFANELARRRALNTNPSSNIPGVNL
jgi:hypothetical protein